MSKRTGGIPGKLYIRKTATGVEPDVATPVRLRQGRPPLMNVTKLKEFCRGFPDTAETLYGEPYNFLVYTVGGKKFAYFKTSQPERWRFSIRVTPERFVELTDVPGVKPARYRGRFYWITIVNVSSFPADYLSELVDWSYQWAFGRYREAKSGRRTSTSRARRNRC